MLNTKKRERERYTRRRIGDSPINNYVLFSSQAILANNSTLYISGVLGLDSEGQVVCGGIEAQTRRALDNLKLVLEAGGASLDSVVKTTILLFDMNDFRCVNQVYGECRYKSL